METCLALRCTLFICAWQAWLDKDIAKLRETISQYALIPPPTIESTAQQGGLFVVDGSVVKFAHQV